MNGAPSGGLPGGLIAGYASVFGVADGGGDVVMRGAFRRALTERGAAGIRLLWQHDPARPIGVITEIGEDARGLHVRGRLISGLGLADEAALLIAAGALDGLSIGFRTRSAIRDRTSGLRKLYDLDLWEVSLVTFPLQPLARVSAAKAWPCGLETGAAGPLSRPFSYPLRRT